MKLALIYARIKSKREKQKKVVDRKIQKKEKEQKLKMDYVYKLLFRKIKKVILQNYYKANFDKRPSRR